ncbi:MAG: hypothetical protein IMY74_05400 [Bacteroidetes bacterium]|nr:hypothetical protein [Bacteroidota bacterium]
MIIERAKIEDMMSDIEGIILEEYRSLLEEHRKNRSYIFERPILILGILAVAMPYFYESSIGQFVLTGLIFILCFNLWFIVNRIRSDALIVAYIQLVHEGELRAEWLGWENALRRYRIWMMCHEKAGDLDVLRSEKFDSEAVYDKIVFYPAIWLLHLVLILLIFVVTLMGWFPFETVLTTVGMGTILISIIIFVIYAFGPFYPARIKDSIESERAVWLCVFEEFRIGERSKNNIA